MPPYLTCVIDHLSIDVGDLEGAIAFYDAALAPLGFVCVWRDREAAGYGSPGGADGFAIKSLQRTTAFEPRSRSHVAFVAADRIAVDAFYAAAIGAGASSDGTPALCPEYGPGYYAAFVIDPEGHRLEAVVHERVPSGET